MKINDKIDAFIEEKILSENLEDVVSERFARYSKYIIQDRALPDARDGLKPVQRRILYGMQQMKILHNTPYKKSARIVGDVMGKYHPHGDSSIYDAMVRMSQDFKIRVPLIDMHGNNGSIDGDSAAAMRYTESRLSLAAEYLLKDIDKKTVPLIPNFDDSEEEPIVLPAKFPNLLVNGATGISAGYATKIPPHNLKEVVLATIALIDKKELSIEELLEFIKGPDFPTGGIVQGIDGIRSALSTGSGKVIVRAKASIEEMSKSQDRIIITEIPYEVNKADLVRSIDMLRIDKKIEDILEIRDETDQSGLRIAVDLKKSADSKTILNYLYKHTELQVNYNYNMVSIFNNRPVLSGALPILRAYLEHQKDVITNRSNYELDKAQKRSHIVLGLIRMVDVLDEVIKTIRESENKADSKKRIESKFGFTELQAEAIVSLQLYRLSSTDVNALIDENKELENKIKELNHILSNEKALEQVIKKELQEITDLLGDERKSEIEDMVENIKVDHTQLITDEQVMIGITKDGYVKRANVKSYKASATPGLKIDDCLLFESELSTLDVLLLFTDLGNYIYLPVYKIEDQKWKDMGVYINNITPIKKDERIIKTIAISNFKTDEMLLFTTKHGMMKQTPLLEFEVSRFTKSMRAMKLSGTDKLVSVDLGPLQNILGVSKGGYALRINTSDLPVYGNQAGGVKCISLSNDDFVAGGVFVHPGDEFIMLTSRGHIIKDTISELPLYSRNRRGILVVEKQKNNPHYVASISRLSKNQIKEDKRVLLAAEKYSFLTDTNELKYQGNKFGKKVIEVEEYGEAIYIDIEKSLSDIYEKTETVTFSKKEVKSPVLKNDPIEDIPDSVVEEEGFTSDKKKIRISRLDFFDD